VVAAGTPAAIARAADSVTGAALRGAFDPVTGPRI
jgi:hypothetical protein